MLLHFFSLLLKKTFFTIQMWSQRWREKYYAFWKRSGCVVWGRKNGDLGSQDNGFWLPALSMIWKPSSPHPHQRPVL